MRFFKDEPNIKFMNKRMIGFALSGLIILAGIATYFTRGFNRGIDFMGGTMVDVSFAESKSTGDIRNLISSIGMGDAVIQKISGENRFYIKTMELTVSKTQDKGESDHMAAAKRIRAAFLSPAEKIYNDAEMLDLYNKKNSEENIAKFLIAKGIAEAQAKENAKQINALYNQYLTKNDYLEQLGKSAIDPQAVNLIKQYDAALKLDINNKAEGDIVRFLGERGIAEDEAKESAKQIISLRKNDGLIRDWSEFDKAGFKHRVISVLKDNAYLTKFTFLSVEVVGPQVSAELTHKATLATVWSLIAMLVYIAFRFKFLYGLSAILTLAHDTLVTLSFILFFKVEISLTVIAAILTLIGYSINDTIVIFDRLRDNLKFMRKENLEQILDKSINQTLSRTIITAGTVFLTVIAIFFFGGEVLHPFAFTMLVGVIIGTYSSIFQSCAWLKVWEKWFIKSKKI